MTFGGTLTFLFLYAHQNGGARKTGPTERTSCEWGGPFKIRLVSHTDTERQKSSGTGREIRAGVYMEAVSALGGTDP